MISSSIDTSIKTIHYGIFNGKVSLALLTFSAYPGAIGHIIDSSKDFSLMWLYIFSQEWILLASCRGVEATQ